MCVLRLEEEDDDDDGDEGKDGVRGFDAQLWLIRQSRCLEVRKKPGQTIEQKSPRRTISNRQSAYHNRFNTPISSHV